MTKQFAKMIMKKATLFLLTGFLLTIISAGCSKDDELGNDPINSETGTNQNPKALLYKEIIGGWKLVKTIPEEETFWGIDYFYFSSDGSCTYHHKLQSKFYKVKYDIIERDDWKVPTIDYRSLPTSFHLRLFPDHYGPFPFVIEGNKMHINAMAYYYTYTAFMFERVN